MNELIINKIKEKFPGSIIDSSEFRGDLSLLVKKNSLKEIALFLRDDQELKFNFCKDVTAIDWAKRKERYTVIYLIYSYSGKVELKLKVNLDESDLNCESLSSVWKSADWYERETFDMYGINFLNHPDLRRVYMPEEFEYHPLRKDFPLLGIPGSLPLPKSEN
jgi:NADH-quinone oxidoreductase subunit C